MTQSEAADNPRSSGPVLRVAKAVIDAISRLAPPVAEAVETAIRTIGRAQGLPISLDVPDAPSGAQFYALAPPDNKAAPAVIYRNLLPSERQGDGWRVTALMARDAYEQVRLAEQHGLLTDPHTRHALAEATGAAIANMGTIPVIPDPARSGDNRI